MNDFDFSINLDKNQKNKSKISKIIFKNGLLEIQEDKLISNAEIFFETGANICIKKGFIFYISNSNIIMKGISGNPNIISGCEDGGSIIIENSKLNFGVLEISKLNFPQLKLRNLYGGVNFINSNIYGNEISLKNSLSEDGINFINSKIDINLIKFIDIKFDALDADFSEFKIGKISCNYVGNDCLDLSYSKGTLDSLLGINIKD